MRFEEALSALRRGDRIQLNHWDRNQYWELDSSGDICTYGGCHEFEAAIPNGDWVVITVQHNFTWARQQLKLGRAVKRDNGEKCAYWPSAALAEEPSRMFSLEDIDATDWVLA
jgi:hypothetical protein